MTNVEKVCEHPGLFNFVADAQRLELRTHTHPCVSLVAPLIGSDFVAGINEQSGRWLCVRQSEIVSLIAHHQDDFPACRFHSGSLIDFMMQLPTPTRMLIGERLISVRNFADSWAIVSENAELAAVSLAAVSQFTLFEAPDADLVGRVA